MSITKLEEAGPDDTYKQVRLALWHPGCWTLRVTEEHAETHLIEKSLYTADDVIKGHFVLAAKGPSTIDEIAETIDGYGVVNDIAVFKHAGDLARVVVIYERESSIAPEIINTDFIPIEPVHITDGEEHWTVLVPASVLSDVLEELEVDYDVQMNSIATVDPTESIAFADVIESIHDDLSPRQREFLFEARDAGYYTWPRNVSANDVAEQADISASTFLEHIRRGEQKILQSVFAEIERRHPRS